MGRPPRQGSTAGASMMCRGWSAGSARSCLACCSPSRWTSPRTLGLAIQGVMALHADTCDLTNPDSPSSTVAIVRDRGQSVDYLALSDSPIVFRKLDGTVEVVHDNRNDYLPGYTVEIVRQQRNAPGGFGSPATNRRRPRKPSLGRSPGRLSTASACSPTA